MGIWSFPPAQMSSSGPFWLGGKKKFTTIPHRFVYPDDKPNLEVPLAERKKGQDGAKKVPGGGGVSRIARTSHGRVDRVVIEEKKSKSVAGWRAGETVGLDTFLCSIQKLGRSWVGSMWRDLAKIRPFLPGPLGPSILVKRRGHHGRKSCDSRDVEKNLPTSTEC